MLTSAADAVAGRSGGRQPEREPGRSGGQPEREPGRPQRRSRRDAGDRDRSRRPAEQPPVDEVVEGPPGDPENAARVICLRLLDRRARSRAELADALARRDIPDDAAAKVLDRLTEVGLIDDAALADAMAGAQHRERGLARRAVALKLRRRGFADDVVETAVGSIDPAGERERARALVERRLRALAGLPPQVQTRRLVGLLARKGYSPGMAYDVVREVLANAGMADEIDPSGE